MEPRRLPAGESDNNGDWHRYAPGRVTDMAKQTAPMRRAEIVQAALRAVGRHGLPMPSYDTVAQEAGMSRQLVRHYFSDPEDLMTGVGEALAAAYRECTARHLKGIEPGDRLSMLLDICLRLTSDEPPALAGHAAAYDAMCTLATASPAINAVLARQNEFLLRVIARQLRTADARLGHDAARQIAFLLVSLIHGHWKMVAMLGFSGDYTRATRQAMDHVITSYRHEDARRV